MPPRFPGVGSLPPLPPPPPPSRLLDLSATPELQPLRPPPLPLSAADNPPPPPQGSETIFPAGRGPLFWLLGGSRGASWMGAGGWRWRIDQGGDHLGVIRHLGIRNATSLTARLKLILDNTTPPIVESASCARPAAPLWSNRRKGIDASGTNQPPPALPSPPLCQETTLVPPIFFPAGHFETLFSTGIRLPVFSSKGPLLKRASNVFQKKTPLWQVARRGSTTGQV